MLSIERRARGHEPDTPHAGRMGGRVDRVHAMRSLEARAFVAWRSGGATPRRLAGLLEPASYAVPSSRLVLSPSPQRLPSIKDSSDNSFAAAPLLLHIRS